MASGKTGETFTQQEVIDGAYRVEHAGVRIHQCDGGIGKGQKLCGTRLDQDPNVAVSTHPCRAHGAVKIRILGDEALDVSRERKDEAGVGRRIGGVEQSGRGWG
ncbi:hypothetical protein ANFP_06730 [Acidithiobacillus ferrooxidans]|nr:hypothetical protein ANFP_06730 [Acidithiobacillus ferrooxidans]